MLDIQHHHQPYYADVDLAPPQEEAPVYPVVPIDPSASQVNIVALLAWAVRTADEHGILEVVEQTTARSSFLAAVQAAEAFLLGEEGPGAAVQWESERPCCESCPSVTCEPTWFSPT